MSLPASQRQPVCVCVGFDTFIFCRRKKQLVHVNTFEQSIGLDLKNGFKYTHSHRKKALFIVGLGIKLMHQLIFDGPYHGSRCLCYYHFHSCNAHSIYYMCAWSNAWLFPCFNVSSSWELTKKWQQWKNPFISHSHTQSHTQSE